MLRKITLHTTLATITDGGEERIDTDATGTCQVEAEAVMLRYAEPENGGYALLLIADGLADLKRRGHIRARLPFISGQLVDGSYRTPHGDIHLSVYTHEQDLELDLEGGRYTVRYTLLSGGRQVADNVLGVTWRFVEE